MLMHLFIFFTVNAVMTSLSCSESCIAQPVQHLCETSTLNSLWHQGAVTLGGHTVDAISKDSYNITVVPKDGGGLSSNTTFIAFSNNATLIHCIDLMAGIDMHLNCSLVIGEFPLN